MDFDDTALEASFREEAGSWLDAHADRLGPDERRELPIGSGASEEELIAQSKAWQATKADAGWACIGWPREYGGRAANAIQGVIWKQEEARYRVPPNLFTVGQGMLGPTIMVHGTDAQKTRHLRPMLRGDEIWCQLFSEPNAGSDLAGLRTRAVRDGDEWVLNGQKIWTSGAHYCRWGMIITRSDPSARKHAGMTYFILDMESSGIEIRPIKQINAEMNFSEVFFVDVRVPDENRVGAVGDGWRGALTTLMNERSALGDFGSYGIGIQDLISLAREVDWNGRPAIEDGAVRRRIAEFYVKLKGLEYTRYRMLTALSRGETPGAESSISKMVGAPLRQQIANFALELQGPAGATMDAAFTPFGSLFQFGYLSTPGVRVAGGTDEILHNILAERVLGLPGEPRVDKDCAFSDIPTGPSR